MEWTLKGEMLVFELLLFWSYTCHILAKNSFLLYHAYLKNLFILVTNLTSPNLCLTPPGGSIRDFTVYLAQLEQQWKIQ